MAAVNYRVLTACSIGLFLAGANTALAAIALPDLASSLHLSDTASAWVAIAYQLPAGAMLLTAGAIGDRWGHRRLYLTGLLLFTAASILCALSWTPLALLGARALQGVAGAVLTPTTMAVVVLAHPELGARSRAIGLWTAGLGLGAAAGPAMGSVLLACVGWRGLFAATAALALAAALFGHRSLPRTAAAAQTRIDPVGQALLALAFGAALFAITSFHHLPPPPGELAGSVALLAAAAVSLRLWLPRKPHGAIALLLPTPLATRAAVALGGALFVVFNAFTYFNAIYLQRSAGLDPLCAGLMMTPSPAGILLVAPTAGRAVARLGPRPVAATGAGAVVVGAFAFAFALTLQRGPGPLQIAAAAVVGIGTGLLNTSVGAVVATTAPPGREGSATGLLASARMLGGAAGVALLSTVLVGGYRRALPHAAAAAGLTQAQLDQALAAAPTVRPVGEALAAPTAAAFNSGLAQAILVCSAVLLITTIATCRYLPGRRC